jgi:hypothetical protein
MKIRMLAAVLATAAMTAGCGTTGMQMTGGRSAHDHATASRPSIRHMHGRPGGSGMAMAGMHMRAHAPGSGSGADQPSVGAAMICAVDTGRAIQRAFGLYAVPMRQQMWMPPVYGCAWKLPHSRLDMAVDDASDPADARQRFARIRAGSRRAHRIVGMANLGFPAFQSSAGMVVFFKDGKVLSVDARKVSPQDLPRGSSREAAAYAVASAVIGCWSE